MGRPKSPSGRRNHENVMLSDDERDLIDSVRGDVKRGPWIREAALEAARRERDSRIQESLSIRIATDGRQPPGTASVVSPGRDRDGNTVADVAHMVNVGAGDPDGKPCGHKNLKLSKGVCPDCQRWVARS